MAIPATQRDAVERRGTRTTALRLLVVAVALLLGPCHALAIGTLSPRAAMFAATDVHWRTGNTSLVASRTQVAGDLSPGCGRMLGGRAPYCVRRDPMVAGTVARAGNRPAPLHDRFDPSRNASPRGSAIECETSRTRPALWRSSYVAILAKVSPAPARAHHVDLPQRPSDLRHCFGCSPSLRAPPLSA